MKKILLIVTFILVAALAFSACGNNNDPPAAVGDGAATNGGDDAPAAGAAGGGTGRTDINLQFPQPIGILDPHYMQLTVEFIVRTQIFESLLLYEDDGSLTPLLALDFDVCADGLVYTFNLRQGVTFHNGNPLTARDVVFSIQRAIDSPFFSTETALIASVEEAGPYTVVVTSYAQSALFPVFVGYLPIMNEAQVLEAGDDIINTPVGTGPYMFYQHNRGVNLVLTANPNHWDGPPSIQTVNFRIIPDASTALIAFEAGELDRFMIPAIDWDGIVAQGRWNTSLNDTLHITFFVFNHDVEPFNDVRIRQAINYAMNRQEMVLFAFNGLATPAYTMTNTRFVFGATDDVRTYNFNPDRARELLAEAGFPDGLTIPPILTLAGSFFEPASITLQANLAAVGITADVEIREPAAYVSDMMAGNFSIGIMGMMPGFDMDQFRDIYHTDNIDGLNMSRFSNARVDELFDIGMRAATPQERIEVYRELLQIVQDEAVYAPAFFRPDPIAYDRNLTLVPRVNTLFRVAEWSWND